MWCLGASVEPLEPFEPFEPEADSPQEEEEEEEDEPTSMAGSATQVSYGFRPIKRRRIHIESEQKRRALIRDGFEDLKQEVPGCVKKMSKALVLNESTCAVCSSVDSADCVALNYVRKLRRENAELLAEVGSLRERAAGL